MTDLYEPMPYMTDLYEPMPYMTDLYEPMPYMTDLYEPMPLESPTRSLEVRAPLGVLIESRAGDIGASCLTDLKLQSLAGADNARPHTERVAHDYLSHVQTPRWPTRSPDTSSVQYVSDQLKCQLPPYQSMWDMEYTAQQYVSPSASGQHPASAELNVRLDSSNVYLPGLRTAKPQIGGDASPRQQPPRAPRHQIYQLCVCSNGKLFLATPEGLCAADDDSLVCR
ncbi:hypothetical protein PR048_027553 [Dryococelus australis]|uniref:Uncharacterized protein n=1 Tax=Dryococelus australis TaxID=614101 RepID=A0ABQ9GGT9_9NEOP|nr:hypothetical protein PR048_027553 [Dryococelus australis]